MEKFMQGRIQDAPVPGERRIAARRKLYLATTASQADASQAVEILDLSATGLLLTTSARLALDEPLAVVLADGEEHEARIVWSAGRLFGCRFAFPLSRAQLSANVLVSDPARGDRGENRVAEAVRAEATALDTLGQRIRALRAASPHSMEELAHRAGVSKPTLWKWETDKIHPRPDALARLAEVLGVGEIELLYGSAEKEGGAMGAATNRGLAEIVDEARRAIAQAAGVAPQCVRIGIDFS